MRVIGYSRVSTEEQAQGGFSLEAQEEKIRGYCAVYELEPVRVVLDPGYSGKDLDRPGIREVLAELRRRKGGVDGLVIAKLDRLTRSLGDCVDLIDEFFEERRRKRLFSVGESIDTRTATGQMMLHIIITVAQWERKVIGERTRDALQAKIRKGERCGKLRFGYDLAPDGVSLVPNAREQEAIGMMKAWKAQGRTYRDLVKLLEDMGIDTKEGGIWRPATIRQILIRPVA
jgi:DNA invertase Pin-like site-specific DNA recombinase